MSEGKSHCQEIAEEEKTISELTKELTLVDKIVNLLIKVVKKKVKVNENLILFCVNTFCNTQSEMLLIFLYTTFKNEVAILRPDRSQA